MGAAVPLAALVLIPTVIVAGLAVTSHFVGGSASAAAGGPKISVAIKSSICFIFDANSPVLPCFPELLTVGFTARVTGGTPPYAFLWFFGDGSVPSYGQTVVHTFPDCRFYAVTVVVLNEAGVASNSTMTTACPVG